MQDDLQDLLRAAAGVMAWGAMVGMTVIFLAVVLLILFG